MNYTARARSRKWKIKNFTSPQAQSKLRDCSLLIKPLREVNKKQPCKLSNKTDNQSPAYSLAPSRSELGAPAKNLKWKSKASKSSTLWSEVWTQHRIYDGTWSSRLISRVLRDPNLLKLDWFQLHFTIRASGVLGTLSFSSYKYNTCRLFFICIHILHSITLMI